MAGRSESTPNMGGENFAPSQNEGGQVSGQIANNVVALRPSQNEAAGQQPSGGNIISALGGGIETSGMTLVSENLRADTKQQLIQGKEDIGWWMRRAKNGSSPDYLTPLQKVGYFFTEFGMPHAIISWIQQRRQQEGSDKEGVINIFRRREKPSSTVQASRSDINLSEAA